MRAAPSLEGVCVPLLSPCSPDGAADPAGLAGNIRRLNAFPLAGYVLFGTTGEGPLLSRAERLAYLRAARDAVPPSRALLAVTAAEGVAAAVEEIERYAEGGAVGALVLTPRYYEAPLEARLAFYREVARRSPLPVLAYNIPLRTRVDLGEQGIRALYGTPGIVGVKDSGADAARMARLAAGRPKRFALLAGSARDLAGQLAAGATGAVLAVANLAPALACAVFGCMRRGEVDRTTRLSALLARANEEFVQPGLAALKAVAGETGMAAGPARLPLTPPDAAARRELLERYARWSREVGAEGSPGSATRSPPASAASPS
jgi:dihydrodipicolinate synthase/N-acetylneuraminate lyase